MDLTEQQQNVNVRKIEDIIDIQKANGSFRQVAFSLPTQTEQRKEGSGNAKDGKAEGGGAGLARSLESGLSRHTRARTVSVSTNKKRPKKLRSKRRKSPLPDVISWPSDSDITVLRMKLRLTGDRLQEAVGDVVLGDGLHQPDGSSMVNLATLVLQSRSPSKRSLNIEEYLLPLSSWERTTPPGVEHKTPSVIPVEYKVFGATCSHSPYCPEKLSKSTKGSVAADTRASTKSKVARFLRLYFCPCCTCLYQMDKMREETSEFVA